MRTSWSTTTGAKTAYIDIRGDQITIGSHYGSGQTDFAGVVSREAFLRGEQNTLVISDHGPRVFSEVLESLGLTAAEAEERAGLRTPPPPPPPPVPVVQSIPHSPFEIIDQAAEGSIEPREAAQRLAALDAGHDLNRAAPRGTLLSAACRARLEDVALLLLERGARVDLRDEVTGRTALHHAAAAAMPKVVWALLDHGADPNAADHFGDTPLHTLCTAACDDPSLREVSSDCVDAAGNENPEADEVRDADSSYQRVVQTAEALTEQGTSIATFGKDFVLPIFTAAQSDHIRLLRILLDAGSSPHWTDRAGRSALHHAASDGRVAALRLLLAWGSDLELPDKHGFTPLHHAVWVGHTAQIDHLLEAGASPSARAVPGFGPFTQAEDCMAIARHFKNGKLVRRLKAYAAREPHWETKVGRTRHWVAVTDEGIVRAEQKFRKPWVIESIVSRDEWDDGSALEAIAEVFGDEVRGSVAEAARSLYTSA